MTARRWPRAPLVVALLVAALSSAIDARPHDSAPPLPAPGGRVIRVSSEPELQAAMAALVSGTTVLIAPGLYRLTSTLHVGNRPLTNVAIRGESTRADDVILTGPGMEAREFGAAPNGIWVGGGVDGVLLANLTIRDFYHHAIILNAGTRRPHLYNVRLRDAGEQLLKANPDAQGRGVDHGIVEYSAFEFTTTSRSWYTNGVDVLGGTGWIIRHNLFRNIRAPQGQLAGPAILMWRGSRDTQVEGNTFVNCQREIALGLEASPINDHQGGSVRNNFISREEWVAGDAGISVFDSPGTVVAHNTIILAATYPNAIEYRFPDVTDVVIRNNLTDGRIVARDGATGVVEGNQVSASPSMFVSVSGGDLHLRPAGQSPVNAGVPDASTAEDWDGHTRSDGRPDVGADETS